MTTDTAAEKILAFIRKHPGVTHADFSFALSMRRQTRQRAHRLLVASGRIEGVLRADGKTLEWRPREPRRPEPVLEPRQDPIPEADTLSAPEASFQPPAAAVAGGVKSVFDMTPTEFDAAFGLGDDPGFGSPP